MSKLTLVFSPPHQVHILVTFNIELWQRLLQFNTSWVYAALTFRVWVVTSENRLCILNTWAHREIALTELRPRVTLIVRRNIYYTSMSYIHRLLIRLRESFTFRVLVAPLQRCTKLRAANKYRYSSKRALCYYLLRLRWFGGYCAFAAI